ncbi:hypothetical protein AVEN_168789-1 [Araneus ventricosus]|uniref:Uncharacterized protein n=2 Tax=Araneus ventricosus TaxID=182803 RepID=A0A4Y2KAC5_ARAVE|nr:hypothetical protein AVEN_168789-1 [Araneus ventricosus]
MPCAENLSTWCENIVQDKRSLARLMNIMKILHERRNWCNRPNHRFILIFKGAYIKEYTKDPDFVQELLTNVITERHLQEQHDKDIQFQKLRQDHELELAKLKAQYHSESVWDNAASDINNSKQRKFTLLD